MDFDLVKRINDKIASGRLVIPTLPEIGTRIIQEMDNPMVSSASVARILIRDPAVAARVIRMANSSLIGSSIRVTELRAAITRIGLSRIKNIVVSIILEQLFISERVETRKLLKRVIGKRIDIACAAAAVNKFSHTSFEQDEVLLFSLLQNVGILPVVAELDANKIDTDSIDFKDKTVVALVKAISVLILRCWGLTNFATEVQNPPSDISLSDFTAAGTIYHMDEPEFDKKYATWLLNTETLHTASIDSVYLDLKTIFN